MRRSHLSLSLILLGLIAGCAEASVQNGDTSCTVTCRSDQVCKNDICYDTCSANKPCSAKNNICLNNLCALMDVSCAPDTRQCSSDLRSVELCADGISYEFEKNCQPDETCELGVCVKNACENDTMRCRNNNVEICRNNSFTIYSQCESPQICMENTFECEIPPECMDGIRRCDENGNVQICSDAHWVAYKTCQSGYSCSASSLDCVETAACEPGALKCNNNSVFFCDNAQWKHSQDCGDAQICDNGECIAAECVSGQERCFESGTVFYRQVCNSLHTYDSFPCVGGDICIRNGQSAECVPNQCEAPYKCQNNILYKCANNEESEYKKCADNEYCDASSAQCKPKCGNGIVEIQNDEYCDGDSFREGLTCASLKPNSIGTLKCKLDCQVDITNCETACTSGTKMCNGFEFLECKNQKWTSVNCADSDQLCGSEGCYKPSFSGTWDYVQDFESLERINTYSSPESFKFTDSGISWDIKARTEVTEQERFHGIDGTGAILKADKDTYVKIDALPDRTVKSFAFDWRSWGGNNDKGTLNILIDGKKVDTIVFTVNDDSTSEFKIDLNRSVGFIELSLVEVTKSAGRIVIDNVRWLYE